MKTLFFVILFFMQTALFSDVILLNSGETYQGKFLKQENGRIFFRSEGKSLSFPLSQLKKLDVGYGIASFCYSLRGVIGDENCESTIQLLDQKKLILASEDGSLDKTELPTEKVRSVTIRRSGNIKILGIFGKGIMIRITSNNKAQIKGIVHDSKASEGIIQINTKESGKVIVKESDITEVYWENPEPFRIAPLLKYTIPGLVQFPQNRWKGAGMMFLFVGLVAAIPYEYNAANEALKKDVDYIPVGNTVIVVNGYGSNPEFEAHQRNMSIAGGALALLYVFHAWDIYRNSPGAPITKKSKTSFEWNLSPTPYSPNSFNANASSGTFNNINFDFRFNHSF
ncbi:MAG: hypothetical protein SFU98_12625 [Leptospiraceae bacterium]|nr:hypothetical protein [Leptospiraceae bacterium]